MANQFQIQLYLQTKGELHPERKEAFEKAQKAYEKLLANTSSLAVSTMSLCSCYKFVVVVVQTITTLIQMYTCTCRYPHLLLQKSQILFCHKLILNV